MNSLLTFNGHTIYLITQEKPWELPNRGWVHSALLVTGGDNGEVKKALVGQLLWNQPILGVEAFATVWLPDKSHIGLLTKEKLW